LGEYKMSVSVGDQAPDFTLSGTGETAVTLSSFRGKQNVVMVFYTGDSTRG
jgi:peroxiredoxin